MQPFPGRGTFFLLRHGATEWNRERRVMGRRPIPLSDEGHAQVQALTPHLEGLEIASVWTSPLVRARATAEIVARALGVAVHEEPGLTEVDYAAWEGRTFPELVGDDAYREFHRDPVATPIPGGGESLLDVQTRVYAAMQRIAAREGGRRVLVVSHGDPLRLILAGCLRLDLGEFRRVRVDNGALSAIELTGDWAEVKFINLHPDVANMLDNAGGGGAAARRSAARAEKKDPEGHLRARDRARPRW
jgi:broad specificity phosphatase PhoE